MGYEVSESNSAPTGVLTISLDFELIWGTLDLFGPKRFGAACMIEREVVVGRLLDLFEELDIPATWCIVGHLFLERCEPVDGIKHPEIIRPDHQWCRTDWFAHDPCGNERNHPLFFGRDLVDKIRACSAPQEIGCHSFSHVIFGDAGCSRASAESEIAACVWLARAMGVELRSFAFPRNQIGHLDVLSQYGFKCYRGPEPVWYENAGLPPVLRRVARLFEVLTASPPPVVLPEKNESGLWNIPGSTIYFPMHGLRRFVPMRLRIQRALKGLRRAARCRRIFHLWFHPTNLADQTDAMFAGLRQILQRAVELRHRGELEILTMSQIAERCESSPGTAAQARPVAETGTGRESTCVE
jgi:peptidoglycan/xylan/chitin deacetylase (PgdA/CDA1 family)